MTPDPKRQPPLHVQLDPSPPVIDDPEGKFVWANGAYYSVEYLKDQQEQMAKREQQATGFSRLFIASRGKVPSRNERRRAKRGKK